MEQFSDRRCEVRWLLDAGLNPLLLECDADRNAVDRNGWSALLVAAKKGLWDIVVKLVEWGTMDVPDKVCILFPFPALLLAS